MAKAAAVDTRTALVTYMEKKQGSVVSLVPGAIETDRLMAQHAMAIQMNPELSVCTPQSLIRAVVQAAHLGLPLGIFNMAWILPFKKKDKASGQYVTEAQLIVGYAGLIDILVRSGVVKKIQHGIVLQGDSFHVDQDGITHEPADPFADTGGDPRLWKGPGDFPVRGFYAIAHLANGEKLWSTMSVDEVEKIRNMGKAGKFGAWVDSWDQMGLKSNVRRLCKMVPGLSSQFQAAITQLDKNEFLEEREVVQASPASIVMQKLGPPQEEVEFDTVTGEVLDAEPAKAGPDPKGSKGGDVRDGEVDTSVPF
jgi:recombination protein RecT